MLLKEYIENIKISALFFFKWHIDIKFPLSYFTTALSLWANHGPCGCSTDPEDVQKCHDMKTEIPKYFTVQLRQVGKQSF